MEIAEVWRLYGAIFCALHLMAQKTEDTLYFLVSIYRPSRSTVARWAGAERKRETRGSKGNIARLKLTWLMGEEGGAIRIPRFFLSFRRWLDVCELLVRETGSNGG